MKKNKIPTTFYQFKMIILIMTSGIELGSIVKSQYSLK